MKKGEKGLAAKILRPEIMAYMTIVGTVIGAGIFGVPYVYAQSGWILGAGYTVSLGALLVVMYLMHADTIVRLGHKARLPGIARAYLGPRWAALSAASSVIGFWLGLLAYLILGGTFLAVIFDGILPLPLIVWQFIFYAACGAVVFAGLKIVGYAEFWLAGLLLAIMLFFLARLVLDISVHNYVMTGTASPFLPYGVILFALTGTASIPEARELLKGRERSFVKVIIAGSVTAILMTLVFGLAVVGVNGAATTEAVMQGLVPVLGPWAVKLGALMGLLAVSTSFFANGLYLRDVFRIDYHLDKTLAGAIALSVPVVAFLAGAQRFIMVIGFTGAIFGLLDSTVLCLSYMAARKAKRGRGLGIVVPDAVSYLIIAVFAAGLAATLLFT